MKKKEKLYYIFAKISPHSYRKFMADEMRYAGYEADATNFLGAVNLLSLLALILFLIAPWSIYNNFNFDVKFLIFGILSAAMTQIIAYLIIFFRTEDRKKRIDDVLPDFLYLAAANLKAGMSPYEALKLSALKEFGPLREEIDRAAAKAYGTESFTQALLDINKRVKSETLDRVLKLFTTAIKAGGHMALLLEELANDISETKELKKEMVTSTKTYAIFIMFIVIVGAPLLMAISIHFVDVLTHIQSKTAGSEDTFGLAFFSGKITITADFLEKVAVAMLITTSLLASMLVGVIKEGKLKYGMRYFLFVAGASVILFFIMRKFLVI